MRSFRSHGTQNNKQRWLGQKPIQGKKDGEAQVNDTDVSYMRKGAEWDKYIKQILLFREKFSVT